MRVKKSKRDRSVLVRLEPTDYLCLTVEGMAVE